MRSARLGKFSISQSIIDERPDDARAALAGCIVVRAEMMWHSNCVDYTAICEDFDPVPEGEIPPTYYCVMKNVDGESMFDSWRRERAA